MSDAKEIFLGALECASPKELASYLDQACAGDAALRTRVEELLRARRDAGSFLGGAWSSPTEDHAPLAEHLGTLIGPYKLLEQIGEGGMGVVYMADQQAPVRRRVALKIIKAGMDTRQVIARFEAERQALALMDHANIARVLDAGATDSGRPYFVMELVRGIPVTEYCDQNNLPVHERLELFIQVCHAVQHAHQKGIIHRDIKPSNVLVTVNDGRAVPKVIDFGVAKATNQQLTEKTLFTAFAQMVGTPLYMSPEQAEMTSLDIDTRSDIYSLGVLLYELLTGTTPFDQERMRSAAFDEIRRIIREEEPPKPSTRISTLGEARTATAAHRQVDSHRLRLLVAGDLDWIVMKALEKDRTRRYDTASNFAADVVRHLSDQPVEACPPTQTYRLKKFIRRNKVGVLAGSAIVVAMALGLALATVGFVKASRQQQIANRITEYMQQILASADPGESTKGPDYKVRELLDDFADTFETGMANDPEVAATLNATIGRAYSGLEEFEKSNRHLTRALELRRALFGTQHEKYADSLVDCVTRTYQNSQNSADFVEAEARLHQALVIYRARGIEGQRLIHALWALQWILDQQGKSREVETVAQEALAEADKTPNVDYWEIVAMKNGLVAAKVATGDLAEAERIAREGVVMNTRMHGVEHIQTAWSYKVLGGALLPQNKFCEALAAEKQSLAIMRKLLSTSNEGMEHPRSLICGVLVAASQSHSLIQLASSADELAELELLFRENLTMKPREPSNGFDPPVVAARGLAEFPDLFRELGDELSAAGKTQEAEASRQKGITLLESLKTDFADHPDRLVTIYRGMYRAAFDHQKFGFEEAIARKAIELKPDFADAYLYLGIALSNLGKQEEAITAYHKAIELEPKNFSNYRSLSLACWRNREFDEAVTACRKAIELQPNRGELYMRLGGILMDQGKVEEGMAAIRRSVELNPGDAASMNEIAWLLATMPNPQHRDPQRAVELATKASKLSPQDGGIWNTLGVAEYRAGEWQLAVEALGKSMDVRGGGDAFDWLFLAMAHWQLGHKDEARQWYDKAVEWIDKNQPKNEELVRFRAEATELLGIGEPQPAPDRAQQP